MVVVVELIYPVCSMYPMLYCIRSIVRRNWYLQYHRICTGYVP